MGIYWQDGIFKLDFILPSTIVLFFVTLSICIELAPQAILVSLCVFGYINIEISSWNYGMYSLIHFMASYPLLGQLYYGWHYPDGKETRIDYLASIHREIGSFGYGKAPHKRQIII